MQVRKFEAQSMQEALRLVKSELGPEAIILSAKDNSRGYGLLHQSSVEITAAIPERVLQKKKYFESRLGANDRLRFLDTPARTQKQLIDRAVEEYAQKTESRRLPLRKERYIAIKDEASGGAVKAQDPTEAVAGRDQVRIKSAVEAALVAGQAVVGREDVGSKKPEVFKEGSRDVEILSLKQEISRLREVLKDISSTKQNLSAGSHPLAPYGLPYEMVPAQEKLLRTGLDKEIVIEILKAAYGKLGAEKCLKKPLVEAFAAQWILDQTNISARPFDGRVHLFVGPSGGGKTSTLVKFASHLVIKEKKSVGVITSDLRKVGAADQLRIFCKILNVPFAALRGPEDWKFLLEGMAGVDHILVDCPGTSLRRMEEIDEARRLLPPSEQDWVSHLVLPATLRDRDGLEMANQFRILKVKDLIFSHVDQTSQHGAIFNIQKKMGMPLNSFGIGPQIPEDFEVATKERVLDLLYKLSQLKPGGPSNG